MDTQPDFRVSSDRFGVHIYHAAVRGVDPMSETAPLHRRRWKAIVTIALVYFVARILHRGGLDPDPYRALGQLVGGLLASLIIAYVIVYLLFRNR